MASAGFPRDESDHWSVRWSVGPLSCRALALAFYRVLSVRVLIISFANAPLPFYWALILAPGWLAAQPSAQIPRTRNRRVACSCRAHRCCPRRASSPGELFDRSFGRPRTFTTGPAENRSWATAGDSRGDDGCDAITTSCFRLHLGYDPLNSQTVVHRCGIA